MSLTVTNQILPKNLGEAHVVADSICNGHRVTTIHTTMHRFVLAEFNTHRVFSRNSASSRAIPVHKRMEETVNFPAYSLTLPAEKAGMQGGAELEGEDREIAEELMVLLHKNVTDPVQAYLDRCSEEGRARLHKSVLARYLEPWAWHRVIVTATNWDGFYAQRISELAQPELHYPAAEMLRAFRASTPTSLPQGGWHLPYVTDEERVSFNASDLIRLSTARCARVSYLTHEGEYDPEKDIALWSRLITADPPHASPLEHPCQADSANVHRVACPKTRKLFNMPKVGNLLGYMQARHIFLGI